VNEAGCFVAYYENFLSAAAQDKLFEGLRDNVSWKVETDDFGPQDRKSFYMADHGCTFKYVGLELHPHPWIDEVEVVKEKANSELKPIVCKVLGLEESLEHNVTACLINNYEEGGSFIPWHFDEVRAHGEAKIILSVSLGGVRKFELQRADMTTSVGDDLQTDTQQLIDVGVEGGRMPVSSEGSKISLELAPGSALLMAGNTQSQWLHRLPLGDSSKGEMPHRISLTFRSIQPGFEENLAKKGPKNDERKMSRCVEGM
jgi:alkylated DNA repair dioxygenase AlkB